MSWQTERSMTAGQFLATIQRLGLSQSACGRYLGVSKRTAARYATGVADVPAASAMLLRACLELGIEPDVPRPSPRMRERWREENRARAERLDSSR